MEIWQPVLGYEGFYEASDLGNLRRVARGRLFSAQQVDDAKLMFAAGAMLKDVAEFLGTSITTAFSIKHGKTWRGNPHHRPVKPHVRPDFYLNFLPCKGGKYKHLAVHRAVWEAFNGAIAPGLEIDHINGIRTDNRLVNLRAVTKTENGQNRRQATANSKIRFLGVSEQKTTGKFRARINVAGKEMALGDYKTPEEAHRAYLDAKRKFHKGCTI